MNIIKNAKISFIFLVLTVLFLIIGVFFLSLYEDWDFITVNLGSLSNWPSGLNYYVFMGGLGNTYLLLGFISSLTSFLSFIFFIIFTNKVFKTLTINMKNNDEDSSVKNELNKLSDISQKLDNLILMKAKGHITEEEFDKIKQKLIIEDI